MMDKKERDRLIVEQAKNIRNYCIDYPTCIECVFMTEKGCVLCNCSADPCNWELPEVKDDKRIKPVTPQPKIGRWIESKGYDDRDHFYSCSECGRNINLICGATLADYPYCHCGAKMEAENDE